MTRQTAQDTRYVLMALADLHGARPVSQVNPELIERYLGTICDLAAATRRNYQSPVRRFCSWMVAKGLRRDPCPMVEPVRQPRRVSRSLPEEDVAALLAALPDLRAHVIVWLMVGCGLRAIEVSRLGVGDYHQRERTLRVKGKGGHERLIPVPSKVAAILDRYLVEEHLSAGPMIRSRVRPSRGIDSKTLSTYMRRWMRDAAVKERAWDGTSAHALRHTCATDVYERSLDLRVVNDMLGHANVATTSRYVGVTHMREMREAIEGRDYDGRVASHRSDPEAVLQEAAQEHGRGALPDVSDRAEELLEP